MSSFTYGPEEQVEHMPWINAAVDTMLGHLKKKAGVGVPLTLLMQNGIDSVPGDTGPREYWLEPMKNLVLMINLPIWGVATWGHLMDRCRDQITIHRDQQLTILAHMTDGAPIINMPMAKSERSYAQPHWLPLLVIWNR